MACRKMMLPPSSTTLAVSATAPNATVANTMENTLDESLESELRQMPSSSTKHSGPHRSHSRRGLVGSRPPRPNGHSTPLTLDTTRSTSRRSVFQMLSSSVFQSRLRLRSAWSDAPRATSRTSPPGNNWSRSSLKLLVFIAAAWPKLPIDILLPRFCQKTPLLCLRKNTPGGLSRRSAPHSTSRVRASCLAAQLRLVERFWSAPVRRAREA
mmetsp:Transcript_29012/g.71641  ORF Transcript_29012/g.71641 Transcript_29012/m.71641 type:complete len:211 (+) Transcript_29012:441-1073(+)